MPAASSLFLSAPHHVPLEDDCILAAFSLLPSGSTPHSAVRVTLCCDLFHLVTLQLQSFSCSLLPLDPPPNSLVCQMQPFIPILHPLLTHPPYSTMSKWIPVPACVLFSLSVPFCTFYSQWMEIFRIFTWWKPRCSSETQLNVNSTTTPVSVRCPWCRDLPIYFFH